MGKAIAAKVAIPSASDYTSLWELCGYPTPRGGRFKGVVAFDPANAGAANVIKATVSGAADVVCDAGSYHDFWAVDMESVQIMGTVTDYVNILGECI